MKVQIWTERGQTSIDPEGLAGGLLEGALAEGHSTLELAAALEIARDALARLAAVRDGPSAPAELELARSVAAEHRAKGRDLVIAHELTRRLAR